MAERTHGGAKKITATLRPRSASKPQRPARRKQTPTSNAAVFADTKKSDVSKYQPATNFPLFSSNLLAKKPPVARTKKLGNDSSNGKQSLSVNHATMARLRLQDARSPTPVEQVALYADNGQTLVQRRALAAGHLTPTGLTTSDDPHSLEYTRSLANSPTSDVCSEFDYGDVFPIQYLPDDCILKIFSLLPSHDKARCAQVCMRWWSLTRIPGLWSHISFSDFPFWCITSEEHNCLGNCYIRYRVRVKQFLAYLKELTPILRSFEFKFDIGENADGFLQPLENLIDKANTKELRYASMNWKETPMRPFWAENRNIRCDEVMQKHRHRQRLFVSFFDLFTRQCPKVETLILPFDWSDRSVECLLRLKNLRSLVIEKYFVFQKLDQDLMDRLLLGLPQLKQLMLEVWTPSGHGLVFFSVVSKTIEYLDVSQSRGFYLNSIHLPNLKNFRIARHPWNGPLVQADRINVPCIYDVLAEGAPCLEKINEHYLEATWRDTKYKTLEEVLKSVCSCRKHKSGWAM